MFKEEAYIIIQANKKSVIDILELLTDFGYKLPVLQGSKVGI